LEVPPAFGFDNASSQQQPPAAATVFEGSAAPATNPIPGFALAAVASPPQAFGGCAASFGAILSAMVGGATPGAAAGGGNALGVILSGLRLAFHLARSIDTGGTKRTPSGKTPGTRRIVKARCPAKGAVSEEETTLV